MQILKHLHLILDFYKTLRVGVQLHLVLSVHLRDSQIWIILNFVAQIKNADQVRETGARVGFCNLTSSFVVLQHWFNHDIVFYFDFGGKFWKFSPLLKGLWIIFKPLVVWKVNLNFWIIVKSELSNRYNAFRVSLEINFTLLILEDILNISLVEWFNSINRLNVWVDHLVEMYYSFES